MSKEHTEKQYDMVLNWGLTLNCTLDCLYCINKNEASRHINSFDTTSLGKWLHNRKWHRKSKQYIPFIQNTEIDIPKVLYVLNNLGKTLRVRLTGGEPFLFNNFVRLCKEITQKHYIDIESNLTVKQNAQIFCDTIDPKRVNDIRAAFHIIELEKKKLIDQYIENFLYFKEKKFHITALTIAFPPIIKKIFQYKKILKTYNIDLISQPFIGYYNGKKYPLSYKHQDLNQLELDSNNFSFIRKTKGQPCPVGVNFFVIYPSGDIHPCYQIYKKLGHINEGFKVSDKLTICPFEYCSCDPQVMDKNLFTKTIRKF